MTLADIASLQGLFLVVTAFSAAFLATSVGAGGGLLLLGLAAVVPAPAVIPIHACIMLFGSFAGWQLLHKQVSYPIMWPFILGGVGGLALAAPLLGQLDERALLFLLASFLLYTTWLPFPRFFTESRHYPWQFGFLSSFLSVFVGATRPMLLAMLSKSIDKHDVVVGTVNACAALQHLGKLAVFTSVGVMYIDHWQIITLLIGITLAGSWCGRHILMTIPGAMLKRAMKLLITGLALALLGRALT